jgi:hypothetical protein
LQSHGAALPVQEQQLRSFDGRLGVHLFYRAGLTGKQRIRLDLIVV